MEMEIQHEFVSEELGVTVRFVHPLRGRHWDAYEAVRSTKDKKGELVGSETFRSFAAALTIIEDWESEDGRYPKPTKDDYEEADLGLIWWLAATAATYVFEVRTVPFPSLKPSPDTSEATDQPPTS